MTIIQVRHKTVEISPEPPLLAIKGKKEYRAWPMKPGTRYPENSGIAENKRISEKIRGSKLRTVNNNYYVK